MTAIHRIGLALCAAFVASSGSKVFADDGFSVELLSGNLPGITSQDGDTIWVFDTNATIRVNGTGVFDVLVVGGGGGGGYKGGGGGGGGGVIYTQQMVVASGEYNLVVGLGGKGAPDWSTANTNGGDSEAFGLVARGGGAGGTYNSPEGKNGASGGGGGVEYPWESRKKALGGSGVLGQGHDGGKGCNICYADYGGTNAGSPMRSVGGGGGGAGSVGTSARYDSDADKVTGGKGGDGVLCEIYGSKYYGGGGGGGTSTKRASETEDFRGGVGGGGNGGVTSYAAAAASGTNGTDGLGGGGGGGGCGKEANPDLGGKGGDGGRGVVILRSRRSVPSEKYLPVSDIAVGGTVDHKESYAIHKFEDDGTFVLSQSAVVDMLIVGGGGGGGTLAGGGGGGGGVIIVSNVYLLSGSYPVTVGKGGAGAQSSTKKASNGENSTFGFGMTAIGGGAGGTVGNGSAGGSGGGAGAPYYTSAAGSSHVGGSGDEYQGMSGGRSYLESSSWLRERAGGGGGAGATGGDATSSAPGNGGDGIYCDFSGTPVCYGGGGGGGMGGYISMAPHYASSGGAGGGGRGAAAYLNNGNPIRVAGEDGTDGLGGGGGGASGYTSSSEPGGKGGSGIVIIRYRLRRKGFVMTFY